ncbi:hypothetical protein B7486_17130 [cyanobacterium TDX16]|nr:hypothetical protein B7486_17130 [cyanobacterium TDX16]
MLIRRTDRATDLTLHGFGYYDALPLGRLTSPLFNPKLILMTSPSPADCRNGGPDSRGASPQGVGQTLPPEPVS